MTVTQRVLARGAWGVKLQPWTPGPVLSQVNVKRFGLGHIVVTGTPIDVQSMTDADIRGMARFVGVYTGQPTEFEMSGASLNWWMGDGDKGQSFSSMGGGPESFATWAASVIPAGITAGIVSAIAGTYAEAFYRDIYRTVADAVATRFGAEWRINNLFELDFGTLADLYRTTPIAVVVRKDGGRDPNVLGIMGELTLARDVEDWVRRIVFFSGAEGASATVGWTGGIPGEDTPYRNPAGGFAYIDKVMVDEGAEDPTAIATNEWARLSQVRQEITLDSVEYDIAESVAVGDALYVYDPDRFILDTANPIPYRGGTIYPEVIRCVGHTWPIKQGMGVYFRRYLDNGTGTWDVDYVDLTEFVVFENGRTTVELGASPRKLKGF